ncbi:MAG: coiled coil domain-containing protein [bacterium]
MNEQELYSQKYQAQLDEWKAEIAKLKAQVSGAKADVQIELKKDVDKLERAIADSQAKLSKLALASEDAVSAIKKDVDTAWDSIKLDLNNIALRFKD